MSTISAGTTSNTALRQTGDVTGELVLQTNGTTTAVTIDTSQNVTLATGNLVIGTSGKGIDFSATPGTGTSELLDDYEEGTFTPTITFGGASVGVTYSSPTGAYYTKVGRLVTVNGIFILSSKGSSTGVAVIAGLPFTSFSSADNVSCPTLKMDNITFSGAFQGVIDSNNNYIILQQVTTGGVRTSLDNTNFSNSSLIVFAASYTSAT
jgi:hypothetical protein